MVLEVKDLSVAFRQGNQLRPTVKGSVLPLVRRMFRANGESGSGKSVTAYR